MFLYDEEKPNHYKHCQPNYLTHIYFIYYKIVHAYIKEEM